MALCMQLFKNIQNCRCISTTAVTFGKKNVRKFPLFHFRWTKDFKQRQAEKPDPDIMIYDYGVRKTSHKFQGEEHEVPEMIPDLIVPDLTDFSLNPYVSYKTPDVIQSEFTAQDLFDAVYSRKIEDDFNASKLNEEGLPSEPSAAEKLTAEDAKKLARKTGSDIFQVVLVDLDNFLSLAANPPISTGECFVDKATHAQTIKFFLKIKETRK